MISGFREGSSLTLVEVTNKAAKVSYHTMSFTTRNLHIPGGGESHVRKFVCEMRYQHLLVRSEVAELIIVSLGKIINGYYNKEKYTL